MRGSTVLVMLAAAVASCSSFGTSATETTDAGPPAGAQTPDAPVVNDAASPFASGFCTRQPSSLFLCEDFDVEPLGAKWSEKAMHNGGAFGLAPSTVRPRTRWSPPRARRDRHGHICEKGSARRIAWS